MSIPSEEEVAKVVDQHKQQRDWSCFQSAPEMWLKLMGVIATDGYPEQSIVANDERGYEPFPDNGIKEYDGHAVHFEKLTFHHPYAGMKDRLAAELDAGNPVVVSLRSAPGQPWHGYMVTHRKGGDFLMLTKTGPPNSVTQTSLLSQHLVTHEKVDCLFMKIADKRA